MSDSRHPRMEPRPRRSGMGLLLPLFLVLLLIYFFVNQTDGRAEFGRRGETIQLRAFETRSGDALARVVLDAPEPRTEFYLFPAHADKPAKPDDTEPATAGATAPKPAPAIEAWPPVSQISTLGPVISCSEVNEHDLVAFFISGLAADSHQPTRSVGYLFKGFHNSTETRRIFVDTDVMPEAFVAVPEALLPLAPPPDEPAAPADSRDPVDSTLAGPTEPAPGPATAEPNPLGPNPAPPVQPAPSGETAPPSEPVIPAHPPLPPEETQPDNVPLREPVPSPSGPAGAAPTEKPPATPANSADTATPVTPSTGPVVVNTRSPQTTPVSTGGSGSTAAAPDPDFTHDPVWGFGRIESGQPERHDRLAALEIYGKTARIRTISSDKIQITGNSFLFTAVTTRNCVHIFWRQIPERGLPSRVINHVVYDGKEFTQEPGLQEGVPVGYFATTRFGDKILMTVLQPVQLDTATLENAFAGPYLLQYALLDAEPTHGLGTGQPPALHWQAVGGLGSLDNLFELVPVERLDGNVQRLLLHGIENGREKILEVTIPDRDQLGGSWPTRPFLQAAPQAFPNADKITVISLVAMLGIFAAIFVVVWLRPWRFFARPPEEP